MTELLLRAHDTFESVVVGPLRMLLVLVIIDIVYRQPPLTLFGTAALVVSLAAGYYLLERSGAPPRARTAEPYRETD